MSGLSVSQLVALYLFAFFVVWFGSTGESVGPDGIRRKNAVTFFIVALVPVVPFLIGFWIGSWRK